MPNLDDSDNEANPQETVALPLLAASQLVEGISEGDTTTFGCSEEFLSLIGSWEGDFPEIDDLPFEDRPPPNFDID